jgi:hypothetical protein
VWLEADGSVIDALDGHLDVVAHDTLAEPIRRDGAPEDAPSAEVQLEGGHARIALRQLSTSGAR